MTKIKLSKLLINQLGESLESYLKNRADNPRTYNDPRTWSYEVVQQIEKFLDKAFREGALFAIDNIEQWETMEDAEKAIDEALKA